MKTKIVALLDVTAVFALTLSLAAIVGVSPLGSSVRDFTNRAFLEYVVMMAVPILILVVSRRSLTRYGISFRNLRYHLGIALTAFVPLALASVPLAVVDYQAFDGALILVAVQVAVLLAVGLLLRRKATLGAGSILAGVALVGPGRGLTGGPTVQNAFSALLFYVLFLGFAEEVLFRGYIQSRLNVAFGRPFTLFGVPWGWGGLIASCLFALMHILNLGSLTAGHWNLSPWWGLWTFFGGLVLAFVREKTGSVAASTLLHGLPQGIAYAFLGL